MNMSLFDRLLGREKRSLASPDEQLREIFGALPTTAAGISVSGESALKSPTVLACVRAISETAGMLPIAVRRREGDGWTKITDHPASRVLNGFSNPWTSSEHLRTQLTADALLYRQGGFAQVIRVRGEPKELHRLAPSSVTTKYDEETAEPRYEVRRSGGGTVTLPWQDVVHLQAPGSTPERPMAPVDRAREAIALDIILSQHEARTFANGGLPRIVLSPEGTISQEALKNALQFFVKQAARDEGKPIVLPSAFKESFRSFGLSDMQFLELRRLAIEDVARALRVPATIIGDLTKGTYSNTEQQNRQFLQLCLLPWLESWESALTRALIPATERETIEVEFVVEDLLRADTAARFTAYRAATGGAWMLPNEARELEGRRPVPEGNTLIRQAGQSAETPQKDPNNDAPDA